ncbi:restriction endonuclease [Paenibacillus sp. WQ 127069]|uniref:Restriction endonuclease n=1 Tax=Paenibacillus baimaensis TaxID=2982185 RepID=A0ABT2UJN9_9BACL|nr:restriction endonuclease [Paenibacillus sp. WQ 127069]MCU6794866.1 restriction endonuclease [Paenibacillus sp. WQ 127069]
MCVLYRRKSKAKQEDKFINGVFGLSTFGAFFGTYYLTKSLSTSFGVVAVAFVAVTVAMIIRKMNYKEKLRRSGIGDIDKMDGREFELYLGELFKKHNCEVKVTQASGDYGADLVIGKAGKTIVVQAKRFKSNVGIKAVQEVVGAIAHYKASEAWVIANSDYTDAAQVLAKSNNVWLISREGLIEFILKMNSAAGPKPSTLKIDQEIPPAGITCSKCGSAMVLRKGSKGDFLGCSSYPKCRHTKAM